MLKSKSKMATSAAYESNNISEVLQTESQAWMQFLLYFRSAELTQLITSTKFLWLYSNIYYTVSTAE
jgi:hypothetical protein